MISGTGNNTLFFQNSTFSRALGVTTVQTKPRTYGKEVILIGILALTLITAFIAIPTLQSRANQQNQQNQQGQPATLWGYVLIGNKGTPYYLYFDNSVTGRITGYVGSDKNYNANLLTGYTYSVTLQYYDTQYQPVNCTPTPNTVTPSVPSGSSSVRQDFSC